MLNLEGEWIGHYPGHFDEVIRIVQNEDELEAVKITGDDFVPAGAITWRANLSTMLLDNAFGNYRDLLEAVSLHPAMGLYLNMLTFVLPTSPALRNIIK